jgi:hypothetical protein
LIGGGGGGALAFLARISSITLFLGLIVATLEVGDFGLPGFKVFCFRLEGFFIVKIGGLVTDPRPVVLAEGEEI